MDGKGSEPLETRFSSWIIGWHPDPLVYRKLCHFSSSYLRIEAALDRPQLSLSHILRSVIAVEPDDIPLIKCRPYFPR